MKYTCEICGGMFEGGHFCTGDKRNNPDNQTLNNILNKESEQTVYDLERYCLNCGKKNFETFPYGTKRYNKPCKYCGCV